MKIILIARYAITVTVIVIILILGIDYWKYRSTQKEIRNIAMMCGGDHRTKLDWPFRKDNYLFFENELTESQIKELSALKSLNYRNRMVIVLKYNIVEPKLKEIRERLQLPVSSRPSK